MFSTETFSTKAFSKKEPKKFRQIFASLSDSEDNESTSLIKKNVSKCCPPTLPKCSLPTIPKFDWPIIPKEFWQYILATPPAVVDGIGFGVLVLAQQLTMLYSMRLMEQDPEKLKEFDTLALLLIMPFLGALGVTSLNICENKEFVEEHLIPNEGETPTFKEQLQKIKSFIRNHPGAVLTLLIGGAAEGIIVQSNVGFLTNQVGIYFEKSNVYKPSIILCSIIGMQFVILNAPHLVELVEKGYTIDLDYTHNIHNRFLRAIVTSLVNGLPTISAGITFALAASESYQLVQYRFAQFQPEDIANQLAIGPAIGLGLVAFACHLGLYGRRYKLFLANIVCDMSEQGIKRYFINLFTPNQTNGGYITKLVFVYSAGVLIAATTFVVGYGATDEAAYIMKYREPPAGPLDPYTTPEFLPLLFKLFVFGFIAFNYAWETYANESSSLFKLAGIYQDLRERAQGQPVFAIKIDGIKHTYTVEELGTDFLRFTLVFGTKFLGDWLYIPDEVTPDEIRIRNTVMSAVLAGLAGVTVILGARVADSFKDKQNQEANAQNTFAASHPRLSFLIKVLLMYGITAGAMISTEVLLRNFIFESVKGEEENRLDDAQLISAAVGGLTTVITMHAWNWASDKVSRCTQSVFNFFKRKPNADLAINNNDNVLTVDSTPPITVPKLPGEKSKLLLFNPNEHTKKVEEYRKYRSLDRAESYNSNSSWVKKEMKKILKKTFKQ